VRRCTVFLPIPRRAHSATRTAERRRVHQQAQVGRMYLDTAPVREKRQAPPQRCMGGWPQAPAIPSHARLWALVAIEDACRPSSARVGRLQHRSRWHHPASLRRSVVAAVRVDQFASPRVGSQHLVDALAVVGDQGRLGRARIVAVER